MPHHLTVTGLAYQTPGQISPLHFRESIHATWRDAWLAVRNTYAGHQISKDNLALLRNALCRALTSHVRSKGAHVDLSSLAVSSDWAGHIQETISPVMRVLLDLADIGISNVGCTQPEMRLDVLEMALQRRLAELRQAAGTIGGLKRLIRLAGCSDPHIIEESPGGAMFGYEHGPSSDEVAMFLEPFRPAGLQWLIRRKNDDHR